MVKNRHFLKRKGLYTAGPCDIILIKDVKPFWGEPYPIPLKNWADTEEEALRQCQIGAMQQLLTEEVDECKWAFPVLGAPKKDGSIQLIFDFCGRCTHLSIVGFLFATGVDLNMGYLSFIIMPFRFFECLVLLMVITTPAMDIFQA